MPRRAAPPPGMEWDEESERYVPVQLSAIERQRLENMAENERHLASLGLINLVPAKEPRSAPIKRPREAKEPSCTFTMRERKVQSYAETSRTVGDDFRFEGAERKRQRKAAEKMAASASGAGSKQAAHALQDADGV